MKTKEINYRHYLLVLFFLFIYSSFIVTAQSITVKGTITDFNTGEPIPGCFILEKGTNNNTSSDMNGNYSIKVNKGQILRYTYIGYKSVEIKVTSSIHNIKLHDDEMMLEESVVVGYATQDRSTEKLSVKREQRSYAPPSPSPSASVSGLYYAYPAETMNNEEYGLWNENRFKFALDEPLSTLSIDVDAASYSNIRRYINNGQLPPTDAIRIEELINYFSYNYPKPNADKPVSILTEVGKCP